VGSLRKGKKKGGLGRGDVMREEDSSERIEGAMKGGGGGKGGGKGDLLFDSRRKKTAQGGGRNRRKKSNLMAPFIGQRGGGKKIKTVKGQVIVEEKGKGGGRGGKGKKCWRLPKRGEEGRRPL